MDSIKSGIQTTGVGIDYVEYNVKWRLGLGSETVFGRSETVGKRIERNCIFYDDNCL